MGVQFTCPGTKWIRGGCIHNAGDLKGVGLAGAEPVLGPEIAQAKTVQFGPKTGKIIPPIGNFLYMSAILPVLGP